MVASPRFVVAAVFVAAIAGLPAQERRPLLGTVVDGDGKPLAGATVQFALVPLGCEHEVAVDHGTATTDDRGRFRANVLTCAAYRLWATGPPAETGTYLASGVTSAAAGQLVELHATSKLGKRTVARPDLAAWSNLAPLQVRVLPGNVQLPDLTFPLDGTGQIDLPPLPDAFTTIEVIDKDGYVMRSDTIRSDHGFQATLPAPQDLALLVVDEKGAPVADAAIRMRTIGSIGDLDGLLPATPGRTLWRPLGSTGADGRLKVRMPCHADPFAANSWPNLFLVAHKPGFAASVAGIGQHPFSDGVQIKDVKELAKKELRFTLRAGAPLRARFVVGERALARQAVTVRTEFRITMGEGNGWMNEELVWHATTDDAGRLEIADLPPNCHETVFVVAADAATLGLSPAVQKECARFPAALHRLPEPPTSELVIDLATFVPLRLQVFDEDKAPPRDARVLLISRATGDGVDGWAPQLVTNGAGRTTVLLQPGAWSLFARNQTGYAFTRLEAAAAEVTLQLEPMPALRGKVVDRDGKPVAGLRLQGVSMSVVGMVGRDAELQQLAQSLCWTWLQRAATAADGSFDCRLLAMPSMRLSGRFQRGEVTTEEFVIAPDQEPLVLTVR